MTEIEFKPWPKLPRLNREIIVTEKIDGTNAAVVFEEDGTAHAQSRKRFITPDDDNAGFARWVWENSPALFEILGPGIHYGEWWGQKIGRKYGLTERRFSLFNTTRWEKELWMSEGEGISVKGLNTVPVLYQGMFSQIAIERALFDLRAFGSLAAPGFMDPEGIVVYHCAANQMFKVTIDNDEIPKALVK